MYFLRLTNLNQVDIQDAKFKLTINVSLGRPDLMGFRRDPARTL